MKMGSGVHVERGHLGVKETVEYLSSLDDHQLVWKYSPWVLRADHKVAMNIFVKRTSAHRRCCQHRSRPHSLWWVGWLVCGCVAVWLCVRNPGRRQPRGVHRCHRIGCWSICRAARTCR